MVTLKKHVVDCLIYCDYLLYSVFDLHLLGSLKIYIFVVFVCKSEFLYLCIVGLTETHI